MRWLTLYARSRRLPSALLTTAGVTVAMWTLWLLLSEDRQVGFQMVALTVLGLVAVLTATLGGPDDALESTAALRWLPRRALHLLVAFTVIVALLTVTLKTGARFGPAEMVVRDTAGLLGLTALGAVTLGVAKAWFAPLGWTLAAVLFPASEPGLGPVLTWQAQPPGTTAATIVATVLAVGGPAAYAIWGPARSAPAEAGQQ